MTTDGGGWTLIMKNPSYNVWGGDDCDLAKDRAIAFNTDDCEKLSEYGITEFTVFNYGHKFFDCLNYVNIICIGQVNKSGNMAGSQKLKHMVDAMLHLSIEKKDEDFKGLRVLETVKNRFGGAGWTFFLDLKNDGFSEVARIGVR